MGEALYLIESSNKTSYIFDENGEQKAIVTCMALMKNESVLNILPDTIPVGSWAYTAGAKKIWQKDFDGSWVPSE